MNEFDLIQRFRQHLGPQPDLGVVLGSGDDAAIMAPPPGHEVVMSVDTAVGGEHFPDGAAADLMAYRALAMNLSDLAAMGARPWCALLALTAPTLTEAWLTRLAAGWRALAEPSALALVGGNLSRGPLSLSITVLGLCKTGTALTRAGAQVDDDVWVSGEFGLATAGIPAATTVDSVAAASAGPPALRRYWLPQPRLALGRQLRGLASAAIDVSDGLLADLGHLLAASGVGADLVSGQIPVAGTDWLDCCTSGDDYELCFTAAAQHREAIHALDPAINGPVTRIGVVSEKSGLRVDGIARAGGYQHF